MHAQTILANLLRREVLVAILVIGVASTALGAVTWAQFSDDDASEGNAVEAGTLNITLDRADSQTGAFSLTNAKPGNATSHEFALRNAGSLSADHVEVGLSFSESDPRAEPSDPDLNAELSANETASFVRVTTLEYRNESGAVIEDALASVSDANGNNNGIKDLEDVRNQAGSLDDLPAPQRNAGNQTSLVIGVAIADDSGDFTGTDEDIMADGIDVKLTFTLNQDAGQ